MRDDPSALYRAEALEAGANKFGVPIRAYGLASWVATTFVVVLIASALIFATVARYSRKETVIGSLVTTTGSQPLVAMRSGVVDQVLAREGDMVTAGSPIVRFSFDVLSNTGESLTAMRRLAVEEESEANTGQQEARIRALDSQVEELDLRSAGIVADLDQLKLDHEIAEQRVKLASEALAAAATLHGSGLMATPQLRQREEAVLNTRQQQGALRREDRTLRSQLEQSTAQRRRLIAERQEIAAGTVGENARQRERRAELLGQEGQLLASRTSGRIASLQVRPGASVQAGQTIGVIVPTGAELEAELWVPSRAVGFLREAGEVRLLYDAYPYQRFGAHRGRVKYVSRAATNPGDIQPALDVAEPMYRVLVTLDQQSLLADGRRANLAPGMRLTADLVLDERPLLIWLLDPILGAHMRGRSGTDHER